jgi:hypothetical protein
MSRGARLVVFGLLVLGLGIVVFTVAVNVIAGLPWAVGAMR